ncbi:MAG: zinc ribbon domain-containing protein [Gemmatimonadetes bacterium]|nr:zinc ribbon domain-containing protein [Gemmatimonadota bacterium]
MPTYDYRCSKGHEFELFQRISDKPVAKCPTCGAKSARMISGGAGLIFKGSGFYITDYGKDGKGPRKAGDTSAESGSAAAAPDPAAGTAAPAKTETPVKTDAPAKKEPAKKAKKEDR